MVVRFLLILFLLLPSFAQASIHVEVKTDKSEVSLEDELHLLVIVEGSDSQPIPEIPSFPNFKETGNKEFYENTEILGGQVSIQKIFSYTLIPINEGTYTLEGITIKIDGVEYKANPITIKVIKTNYNPNPSLPPPPITGINPPEPFWPIPQIPQGSSNQWITTDISNKNSYVGESILYIFRYYSISPSIEAKLDLPVFKDIKAEELVAQKKYQKQIEGKNYFVYEKIFALIPQKSGPLTIEPTTLSTYSGASPFSLRDDVVTLKAQGFDLNIKPLPTPPANFSNLIGTFSLVASLDSSKIKDDESATLTLTLNGKGDIRTASLPSLSFPHIKTYVNQPESELIRTEEGLKGQKTFKIALVPESSGTFTIPPILLSYFDPSADKYIELSSPSFTLEVSSTTPESPPPSPSIKEELKITVKSHVSIKVLFIILGGFISFLLGFILFKRIQHAKTTLPAIRKRQIKVLGSKIKSLKNEISPQDLLAFLRNYFREILTLQPLSPTPQEVMDALEAQDVSYETKENWGKILNQLEAIAYGQKQSELNTQEIKKQLGEIHRALSQNPR